MAAVVREVDLGSELAASAFMAPPTGAVLIAKALQDLGVKVIFGLVGIPVVQIAEEAIALGIRFIAFRNEQAASYAATAYGYLTGKPGVCLVVGGPGVSIDLATIFCSIRKFQYKLCMHLRPNYPSTQATVPVLT